MSTGTGDFKQLLYASRDGDLEGVKHWLMYDVDPNFLHPEFMFAPLHISIRNGHLEVARVLLENGADPMLEEGFSAENPLSIAQANNDEEAIHLLKTFGVETDTPISQKVRKMVANYLLKHLSF